MDKGGGLRGKVSYMVLVCLFIFSQQVGSASYKLAAETATEAVSWMAVALRELDESLCVCSVEAGDTSIGPLAYDAVGFWWQGVPDVYSPFAEAVVALVSTVGKEDGHDAVNHDEPLGMAGETLFAVA